MAKVYVSSVIAASVGEVWHRLRDFNGLPDWTPFCAESHIEDGKAADQVGCIRNFRLKDGGQLRERLLAFSDRDCSYTYGILESPLGVENYVATLSLTPVTDGHLTFAQWTAEFDAAPEHVADLVAFIGGSVFHGAFTHLKQHYAAQA